MSTQRAVPWACPPKVVLAAVDFGDASARALAIAGLVASGFDARLRAIHAERFEPPPYFTLEQIARLESERAMAQAAAAAHLMQFVAGATPYPSDALVLDEPPVDAILDASAAADLIVMGTHGRRGPGRWWLGSVAERVARAAAVPVLVTRAGATSPRDVFARVVLVHDGREADEAARLCADRIATIAGGLVTDGGPVTHCDADVLAGASLVVASTASGRPPWSLGHPVARILGVCDRPVLFIPTRLTSLGGAS